jgi:diadenosine tetraphosphate (Ap4A) HIT family hydrolase
MTRKQYNRSGARVDAQLKRMEDLEARGVCAFCPENLADETTSPIVLETDHWVVKDNDFPYERTKHHLLLIPKIHKSTVSELPPDVQADFLPTVATIEEMYALGSFAVAMRSGDMRLNGGTVDHIHAHIIVGDTDDPNHEPVRFKVSSRPEN